MSKNEMKTKQNKTKQKRSARCGTHAVHTLHDDGWDELDCIWMVWWTYCIMIQMVKWSGSGQSTEECNMQWKKLKGKEASPQTEKKSWTDVKWLDLSVTYLFCVWHNLPHNQTRQPNCRWPGIISHRSWTTDKTMDGGKGVLDWRERREHGVQSNSGSVCSANEMKKNERMPSRTAMADGRAELKWNVQF